jgi:acyl carrier protein
VTRADVTAEIAKFVCEQNGIAPDDPGFDCDVDLFECGYVDSVGLVELLEFITSRFEVEIDDEDLLSEAFSSINGMAGVVCRERDRFAGAGNDPGRDGRPVPAVRLPSYGDERAGLDGWLSDVR